MDYQSIKHSVVSAIKNNLNNYAVDDKKIVVNDVRIGDEKLDKQISWNSIQKTKNRNGTVSAPIYANIEIKKGNKVLSKDKNLNIGQLPIVTRNQTVLIDGVEYTVPVQLRRDPGIYTSQSANGKWITAINSEKGRNFKVEHDPITNIQKIEIEGTRIPLLPILHNLGYNKDQIIKSWGNDQNAKDLYNLNLRTLDTATGKKALRTLYKKLIFNADPNANDPAMKAAILGYMANNSKFRPEVNKMTLGNAHETLSPDAFLDISKKLVNSSKHGEGDDTENLIYKHFRNPNDLLTEKINLDFKKKLTASLNRNLKNNNSVKDIVRPGMFTKTIKAFFNESKISEPSEQINPLHILNTATKITIKGEGGITDEHTVNMDMKSLHPSYFGFIDPLHTPDGSAGLVNHLTVNTSSSNDGKNKLSNLFYNKKGQIENVPITKTWHSNVASPDQFTIKKGSKPIPKTAKIKVMNKGETLLVPASQVDYILAHSSQLFDPAINLIPFINSNSGNRVNMGGKYGEQSISLVHREPPNVSTITRTGKEFPEIIGKFFSILSPVNGKVRKITKDFIEIKSGSKSVKVELRNHMELNQESFFHDEPVVKVGDTVKKGDLIAKNNWTDDKGRLSLGVNARVGYIPYKGYAIEDGAVISDSFSKKLASQHIHVEEVNIKEGGLNLEKFKLNFKNKYSPDAYDKLDSSGVVRKGVKVDRGNILVAYAKPFEFSENDAILGKVMKGFKNKFIDQSIVWNYDFPGEVIDVNKSGNLIKVKIKSIQPAEVTDKLANRYGGKGIISNIVPDNEMPHTKDGKPLDILLNPHSVACIKPEGLVYTKRGWTRADEMNMEDEFLCLINGKSEWHKPIAINEYDFDGEMCEYEGTMMKYSVTPNHEMYFSTNKKVFQKKYASDIFNKIGYHKATAEFNFREYISGETITLEDPKSNSPGMKLKNEFDLLDFAEFLGWYIAEGSTTLFVDKRNENHFRTEISQSQDSNPEKFEKIKNCLERLGLAFHVNGRKNFRHAGRIIFNYCSKLGKSNEKHIPEECWSWPKEALKIMFDTMIQGDGFLDVDKGNYIKYITVSERLANDFERLALLLNYNAKVSKQPKKDPYYNEKLNKLFISNFETYTVNITDKKFFGQNKHKKQNFLEKYKGKIYCPTLPGGLMFYKELTYRGFWISNSRINTGQMLESSLGKITEKTGKRYLIENYEHPDNWEYVKKELSDHNVTDTETVIDPTSKKELKSWNAKTKEYENPFVGNTYIHKLVHQTRKKFDARGRGAYSAIEMPGKNPESSHYIGDSASKENPKSVDRLTSYSLLAHGTKNVIKDMWNNKGQNRPDVWDAIINGAPIPPPKISTATQKGIALLRAAGVNTERKGRFIKHVPLTDTDTIALSSGKIPKPNLFLRGKDLMPIKGGMFDRVLTGGDKNFTVYNHIDLETKIPNPITKNAIKILLDLKDDEYEAILKGEKTVDGKTGVDWFEAKLKAIDLDTDIKKLEDAKKTAPKTRINTIIRKLRYLRALKNNNLKPEDYLISKLPVIPTGFRPILALPNGTIEPAPLNHLYRDTAIAVKLANEKTFPKFLKDDAKYNLYKTISGLQGVTEPTINSQNTQRQLRSALTEIAGSGSPKGGFIHSKLLSKTQDYIGSSVAAVDPHLGIDEVGIPYEMAAVMYEPFLLKELKNQGYKITDLANIKKTNPLLIKGILEKITKERPVILNRNPSLHKGSTVGLNPRLINGKSIKVNPLILSPLNLDFDGDTLITHVPISKEAVEEVKGMIPSLNILNSKNDSLNIKYDQEYMAGISLMTDEGRKTTYKFKTVQEAQKAYEKNQIRVNDQIKIGNRTTTLGRFLMMQLLPKDLGYDGKSMINKGVLDKYLMKLVEKGSITKYTDVVNKLKNFGAKYAHDEGFSFSLDNIKPRKDIRAKHLSPAIPFILKDNKVNTGAIMTAAKNAQDQLDTDYRATGNRFYKPAVYGSRGIKKDVMMQMTVSPFFVAGMKDRPVKTPISKSYSEGLDVMDNFNASFGARKAIVDKVNSVAEPGALSKEMVASFSGECITMKDCGTDEGVKIPITDTFNLQNRVLAKACNGVKAGTVLDSKGLLQVRKGTSEYVTVRSPLTCKAPKGVCAMCYGYNENHQLPKIGEPIGLKAAQSIGETGTQSALSSHHLGGTVSAGSFRSGFEHTKFILHMPQNVKVKATLAGESGTITDIKPGLNNTHLVFINNNPEAYIVFNDLKVKKGDKVTKGDPLDTGNIKIQELAELAPMRNVQDHMVNELEKSFGGTKILRRNTETVVRGTTSYGKVTNPGNSPFQEGEIIPIHLANWIKEGKPVSPQDVIGWKLGRTYGNYPAGTQITIEIADDLLKHGHKAIVVNASGLEYVNQMTNISTIPLIQPDLLKRMSFEQIRNALKEGPISGAYSNIHNVYPEPALVMGTEFGDSEFY